MKNIRPQKVTANRIHAVAGTPVKIAIFTLLATQVMNLAFIWHLKHAGLALAIRLESPGPILFKQKRVGRWGQLFTMWKFRSMFIDAEARKAELMKQNEMQGGVIFKMKDDPRVTRVGRIIRKTSLDELPQLWNVFVGDMSLVGPRPPVPAEVDQYSLADRRRLEEIEFAAQC
jgi:lipopolysaccharide/colanic/teichoic acid biosynthesis glycosyltransferase